MKVSAFSLFFVVSGFAAAQIDSGGGRAQVGILTNHASIGATIASGTYQVGASTNRIGLVEVLYSTGAATNPDANGNGLPDAWESQYFPGQTVDPQADSDSDGTSNLMEYLAGTDPTNWGSSFRPAGAYATGTYTMPIQTITGRTYKVWVSLNMTDWFTKETFVGDGTQKVFSFDETAIPPGPLHSTVHPSQYFFRVEVILP